MRKKRYTILPKEDIEMIISVCKENSAKLSMSMRVSMVSLIIAIAALSLTVYWNEIY